MQILTREEILASLLALGLERLLLSLGLGLEEVDTVWSVCLNLGLGNK